MSYWLGIDVGTTFTAAAVCRQEAGRPGMPEVVGLGTRSTAVSSVLFLAPDGAVVVGEAAERRAVTDPDRVAREFKRRIGDEVPMVVGGRAHAAPEIAAMMLGWVIARVAAREGGPAAGIVVTHPAGWGPYKISTVMAAVGAAGLASVTFCTEPEAAAAGYAVAERIESGSTIAVYDLGGGTFDAAVVRKTGAASWRVLGVPQGLEAVGGADFDDAIMGHVLAAVPALAELDGQDPAVLAAMVALRRECTEAKEALSSDTEVTIPVLAPGVVAQVRLVRAEFEEMIRPLVVQTVEALRRALRSAQVEPADLDAVLLVGGSSRVPLVAQLVSAELGRPIAVDADPIAAIALGAALCALPTPAADVASKAPVGVDAASPLAVPEPETPALSGMEALQRPSLTAIPLDVEPAALQLRRTRSRLVKRVAVAGALSLLAAGGVAAVPLLTSQSGPVPQAAAGTPAPAPANPPASPSTSGDNSAPSGAGSNPILAVPVTASTKTAGAATKPASVRAQPAGLQTVGSTRPPAPTSTPSPTTPAPIGAAAGGASGRSTVDPPTNSTGSSTNDGGGKTGGNTTDGGDKTGGGKTGGNTTGGGSTTGGGTTGGTTGGGSTGGSTGGTTGGSDTTGGGSNTTGGGSTTGGSNTGGTTGTGAGTTPSGSAPAAQHA